MTNMIDDMTVTVTDEVTLLRERLDEAHAYIDNVERERDAIRRDRDAALAEIGRLRELDEGNHRLIDTITDGRNNKARLLEMERKAHDADITRLMRIGEKREMWSTVGGFLAGVTAAGLMVAIVYLIR